MELTELKNKIREYFKEVDPDELYELALSCGFKEIEEEVDENEYIFTEVERKSYVFKKTTEEISFEYEKGNIDKEYLKVA